MLKDNHELRMKYAELLANTNNEIMLGSEEPIVYFEFEGVAIHDPFTEESGRFEVDPVEYYGEAFLNSAFYNPLDE